MILGLCFVLAAVPWLCERHLVARVELHVPELVVVLRFLNEQPKGRAETVDCEGSNLDTVEPDGAQVTEAALAYLLESLTVHLCPCSKTIDVSLKEVPFRVEQEECHELLALIAVELRQQRSGQKELSCAGGHRLFSATVNAGLSDWRSVSGASADARSG